MTGSGAIRLSTISAPVSHRITYSSIIMSELRILRAQKAQMPKEEITHERVLQEISSEELRQFIEGEW